MISPAKHTAQSVRTSENLAFRKGRTIPARPVGYAYNLFRSIGNRLALAWGVFIGRYDALDWEDIDD